MKKRMLSLALAFLLSYAMLQFVPLKTHAAKGVYTWIKDRDAVAGSDYTTSTALARKLDQIFDGNASIYSNKECTQLVDTRIGTSNVKNDGVYKYVGPNGGRAINIGTSCWIYANGVYYTLFGECTGSGVAGPNSEKLNLGTTSGKAITYQNFQKWGVRRDVGALIRANGHSMIVLDYDQHTLTILDGNGDGKGLVSIRIRSWDQISGTVEYIVQPKEAFYYDLYPACSHQYDDVGVCTICGEDYYFEATYNADCIGIYTVSPSDGIILKTDKPYSASQADSELIPAATEVEVLGSVMNHLSELWYQVSCNGITGYTKAENLTWVRYSEQQITCVLTSPAEGAVVPQASYPVIGTVTSKYPLYAVNAYIDGQKYTTVTVGDAATLNIQTSSINRALSFSSLAAGPHTLMIEARDIHHDQWVTVCTRNFVTKSNDPCSDGHDWTEEIPDADHLRTAGTNCTEMNTYWYDCSRCSAISEEHYFVSTVAGAHSFTELLVDEDHLVPGTDDLYYYDCAYCDAIGMEIFADLPGNLDKDAEVDEDDAIYLLQAILMPDLFPVTQGVDFDDNGDVNEDDAIYLLQYILMPDLFPLQ